MRFTLSGEQAQQIVSSRQSRSLTKETRRQGEDLELTEPTRYRSLNEEEVDLRLGSKCWGTSPCLRVSVVKENRKERDEIQMPDEVTWKRKHLLALEELSPEELRFILDTASS